MDNGELIKSMRTKLDWSQKDLADYFNVPQPRISNYENGERPIPNEVLKKAREVRRTKKQDAQKRFNKVRLYRISKNSTGVEAQKNTVERKKHDKLDAGYTNSVYFPGEICSQNAQSVTFPSFLQPEAENSIFSQYKEGSTERYILECYVSFKRENKRYPTDGDFMGNEWAEVSKHEVLEDFGSLSKAKAEAERFRKAESAKHRRQNIIHTFPMAVEVPEYSTDEEKGSFVCPLCGKLWRRSNRYYPVLKLAIKDKLRSFKESQDSKEVVSRLMDFLFGSDGNQNCFCGGHFKREWQSSFKTVVSGRLSKLLQADNEQSVTETIELCYEAIFGKGIRFKEHRVRCDYCKKWKWYWRVTLDDSYRKNICNDCLEGKLPQEEDDYDILGEAEPATIEAWTDEKSKDKEWNWNELFKYRLKPGKSSEISCFGCGKIVNDWEAPISFASGKPEFVCKLCSKDG